MGYSLAGKCQKLVNENVNLLLKLIQGHHIALFDQEAICTAASYFQAPSRLVVVRRAISCGLKLRKQLQVC